MADLYTKTSSGVERIDVSVPKIEERVTNLENNKLGKTEKAASALVADSANSIEGANVKGTVANATNAVNAANATTATSATSASSVPWTGITNKPTFAAVATTGSYNDLTDKPSVSSGTLTKIFDTTNTTQGSITITITGITPNKLLYVAIGGKNWYNGPGILAGTFKTGVVLPSSTPAITNTRISIDNCDILSYTGKDSRGYYSRYTNGYAVVLPSGTSVSLVISAFSEKNESTGSITGVEGNFTLHVIAYQ